jgi:hypothetical protein
MLACRLALVLAVTLSATACAAPEIAPSRGESHLASSGDRSDAPMTLGAAASLDGAGPAEPAPPPNPTIDAIVEASLDATRSPGIAAAIVRGSELKCASGFGLARISTNAP